jgi:hypothetical protein
VILFAASQYHYWSKLSSGSAFSAEFPLPVVILFNWAFGAIILLAPMQLLLDVGTLIAMLVHGGGVSVPDGIRYGLGTVAVHQALRVPPLKDIEIGIRGLAPRFDGYTMLQLTDLHISRLRQPVSAEALMREHIYFSKRLIVEHVSEKSLALPNRLRKSN